MDLFPALEVVLGRLAPAEKRLVAILEVVQIKRLVSDRHAGLVGRPLDDRRPFARAFVAKSVLGLTSTRSLLQTLAGSPRLRRICGLSHLHDVPGESTFSRAFGEFADADLGQRIHESLVKEIFDERLVGHVCRDSTTVEAPERPPARKKGEKRKRKKPSQRISRQLSGIAVEEMVAELPKKSTWGCKINSRGYKYFWPGYKLHIDSSDCGIF